MTLDIEPEVVGNPGAAGLHSLRNINKKFASLLAEFFDGKKVQIVIKLLHNATQTVRSVWQQQQRTVSENRLRGNNK